MRLSRTLDETEYGRRLLKYQSRLNEATRRLREEQQRSMIVVFEGPEDYHERINDPALGLDENSFLFIRGVGCVGYPGSAEVVNMQPPDALIRAGIPSEARASHASSHRQAGAIPALSDDVYALAALTFDLLVSRAVATCSSLYDGADPVRLARVFRQALAKQPEERTATALEFAAALQESIAAPVQGTPIVSARPVEPAAAAPAPPCGSSSDSRGSRCSPRTPP